GSRENLQRAVDDSEKTGNVELIEGDILDFEGLMCAMAHHDVVIHLAAYTRVCESVKKPRESLALNSAGTLNVLEAARKQNVDRFVFASSNAAVGEQTPPINESMVPKPLSPYGAVKLYGEALCSAYYQSYGLNTTSLRFANAYGPYSQHKTSVIAKFLRRTLKGKSLEVYGDGNQTRDFIHATDIAQAIHLVLICDPAKGGVSGEIFQVATGIETRIIDVAKMISGFVGKQDEAMAFGSELPGEIRRNFSDISKARNFLGFEPKIRLLEGMRALFERSAMNR
ncbi:GDP-mannose 4,6-dehydratase, partial [Candidatus Pacearchaeota archaeon]|nr:GDP-mannose 4,6-dehydratase [Candidatus Pacearchaeota archaeon]